MTDAALVLLTLLATTLPGGYLLMRQVLRAPPVHGFFDTGSSFFAGLLLNIAVLNGLQWFPRGFDARNAFWLLASMHFIAIVWLLIKNVEWRRGFSRDNTNCRTDRNKSRLLSTWFFGIALSSIALWSAQVVLQLPVIGWDAWSGWVAKAKIWQEHGLHTAIVPVSDWLAAGSAGAGQFSSHMWHYPDAVGLLYAVLALIAPTHVLEQSGAAVLWPLCGVMLAAGMFGYFQFCWGQSRPDGKWLAMAPGFLLLLTPLWLQHMLLPGYADLLLACFAWYAAICYLLWRSGAERGFWRASILFLAALPLIKLMGWLLLILFGIAHVTSQPRYYRLLTVIAVSVIAAGIALWFFMPLELATPFGQIKLDRKQWTLPGYGRVQFGWFFPNQAWIEGLFFSRNWLLLWFGMPVALWLGLQRSFRLTTDRFLCVLILGFLMLIFFMYGLTSFSQFASAFTSSNRVLMHIYPLYLTCLFLLTVPRRHDHDMGQMAQHNQQTKK